MWGAVVALLLSLVTYVTGFIMVYSQDSPNYIAAEFRDLPASFGGGLPLEGMRGQLTAGEPRDGCSPLAPPPPGQNDTKWIVLIARYNCSFEVKVRNAQAAGYDCAIVHNVNASDLETMSAKNAEDIVIPSVFVSDVSGEKLAAFYLYDNDPSYYLVVNGDVPFDINTNLLLPFAIVVAICLLVMLVFMIVKCMNERARARRHRLPNRALRKIPTCKFSKGDPYETCAICLDDYLEGERLRVLPCAHAYHAKCIDPWLTQNRRVCPVCKRRVLAAGERRPQSDSDSDGSDHRPLVSHEHRPPPTQGGTFEQQRENPFVRAARFMARLRSRNDQNDSQEAPIEEPADVAVTNEDNVEDDTQPLLQASVMSQSERPRRSRRHGRSRRFAPGAQSPLRPAEHSINRGGRGEIGVAALPATPETHPPTHVSL